jgi:hypothetical protein
VLQSRHGFLIDAGAVLTTAFVRALVYSPDESAPAPRSQVVETMSIAPSPVERELGADRSLNSMRDPTRDSTQCVNAKDMVSLSLLQARLVELKLPIKIAEEE